MNPIGAKAERQTILIVDDEESFHKTIAAYVRGYSVLRSYTASRALKELRSHRIDAVLVDLNLPDTDGFRLVEEIMCDRDAPPIVIVSVHAEIPNVVRAVRSGAVDFVEKSAENYARLPERIENAVAIGAASGQDGRARALQRSAIWLARESRRERTADALRQCGRTLIAQSMTTDVVPELCDRARSLYRAVRDHFETLLVRVAVARCGGNKRAAAEALGVSYSTVMRKTGELDPSPPDGAV